jgi:hypothetical protein
MRNHIKKKHEDYEEISCKHCNEFFYTRCAYEFHFDPDRDEDNSRCF